MNYLIFNRYLLIYTIPVCLMVADWFLYRTGNVSAILFIFLGWFFIYNIIIPLIMVYFWAKCQSISVGCEIFNLHLMAIIITIMIFSGISDKLDNHSRIEFDNQLDDFIDGKLNISDKENSAIIAKEIKTSGYSKKLVYSTIDDRSAMYLLLAKDGRCYQANVQKVTPFTSKSVNITGVNCCEFESVN